ncbi:MAG TPA: hypothetical protein VG318_16655 [Actinomycetota bacterium]|nr:hypothetical protein [Actinomycetota bacterium]
MKKLLGTAVVGLLVAGAVLPAGAKPAAKATMVFEDAAGDAGNYNTGALPGVSDAGFDLTKGEVSQEAPGKDVTFVVTHSAMPSTGTPGEAFRMIWGFAVDGTQYEFTVKSVDVGEPDVVTSAMTQTPTGTERVGKVYQGVARLEECGVINAGIDWSQCSAKEYFEAVFDPAAGTVTWSVPVKSLGAKKGSLVTGGGGSRVTTGCMICWVPQYAERSLTPHSIIDAAVQSATYKVR